MTMNGHAPMNILLTLTAVLEAGIGLELLARPSVVVSLLFASTLGSSTAESVARVAGAALLALGVACWLSRRADAHSPAAHSLAAGMTVYNLAAAVILAAAGIRSAPTGIGLWPTFALHTVMGGWCVASLLKKRPTSQ